MNRHHVIRPSLSLSQRSRSVECSICVRVKCLDEREIKVLNIVCVCVCVCFLLLAFECAMSVAGSF